ncbi:MAG: hypothetical protein ACPGUZ_01250 [Holosporaceae bacterium]
MFDAKKMTGAYLFYCCSLIAPQGLSAGALQQLEHAKQLAQDLTKSCSALSAHNQALQQEIVALEKKTHHLDAIEKKLHFETLLMQIKFQYWNKKAAKVLKHIEQKIHAHNN